MSLFSHTARGRPGSACLGRGRRETCPWLKLKLTRLDKNPDKGQHSTQLASCTQLVNCGIIFLQWWACFTEINYTALIQSQQQERFLPDIWKANNILCSNVLRMNSCSKLSCRKISLYKETKPHEQSVGLCYAENKTKPKSLKRILWGFGNKALHPLPQSQITSWIPLFMSVSSMKEIRRDFVYQH